MILVSDTHLEDGADKEYRWAFFEALREQIRMGERRIFHLGDLTDKKDRHSAALVNRIIQEFDLLATDDWGDPVEGLDITVLKGNHDQPLKGDPFWAILDTMQAPVCFIYEPTTVGDMMFLPHSENPAVEWASLDFTGVKVVFIHQTLTGVKAEGGAHHVLEGLAGIPKFPPHVKVYSGDIHLPQTIKWGTDVTYVGAPHRVRFGDDHQCRLLRLDDVDYSIIEEIHLDSPQKAVVEVSSVAELKALGLAQGDMARVRFVVPPDRLESFAVDEAAIKAYAAETGIVLDGIAPIVDQKAAPGAADMKFDSNPITMFKQFAAAEGLDPGLLEAGMDMLKAEGFSEIQE